MMTKKTKRGQKMKVLLSIVEMLLMFLVGCSNQENSITSPISPNTEQFDKVTLQTLELNTVDETVNKLVTTTQVVDGTLGGTISLIQNVISIEGREVSVDASIKISKGAFIGTKNITMSVDVNNGCISFSPHMIFNTSCFLDYRLSNMNLANLGFMPEDTKAEFVFFNDEGGIEAVQNFGVKLSYSIGYIKVQTAKIDHFSRYGFCR